MEAVGVTRIPQGIDELVPLDGVLAVRCGPTWMGLAGDLTGELRSLNEDEAETAEIRSSQVNLYGWNYGKADREWTVPLGDREVRLPQGEVEQWGFSGSISPDRKTFALGGCLSAHRDPLPTLDGPYVPEVWSLVLVDLASGAATRCEGQFEGFPYPPTWTADSSVVVVGAPFDPKHLYVARRSATVLEAVAFRRQIAMPLLDASLVSP